jgi:hypothetical protein
MFATAETKGYYLGTHRNPAVKFMRIKLEHIS